MDNALAAIAICYALGIRRIHVSRSGGCQGAGRMELFMGSRRDLGDCRLCPQSHDFDRLFRSTIKYPDRHVIAVFGCPGKKHWRGDRNWQNCGKIFGESLYYGRGSRRRGCDGYLPGDCKNLKTGCPLKSNRIGEKQSEKPSVKPVKIR